MKLSPKKQQALYNAVSEEVMLARIAIKKIYNEVGPVHFSTHVYNRVDDILSDLGMKAPIAATKQFKEPTKAEPPAVHPAFKRCVDLFHISYPDIFFEGSKDGSNINRIIKKLEKNARDKGKNVTPDTAFNGFAYAIAYAKRVGHYVNGKDLSTWNSKLGEVIHEINNGKQQRTSNNAGNVRDFAANL